MKYRANRAGETSPNGATPWYSRWMGGPSLVLVRNCPTPFGPRTVYAKGDPDTFFSIPAKCQFRKRVIHGWLGCEHGNWQFHADRNELPFAD